MDSRENISRSAKCAFENFTNSAQMNFIWPMFAQEQYRNIYSRNQWQQQVANAFDKEISNFAANNTQSWVQMDSGMLQEYLLLMQQQKINQEQFWLSKQQELQRRALQTAACSIPIQYPMYNAGYKENLNDISKSLRKFSANTAMANDDEILFSNHENNNIDAVMKDFAVNGCTKDAEPNEIKNNIEYTNDHYKKLNSMEEKNWKNKLQQQIFPNNMFPPLNQKTRSKRSQSNKKQKKMAGYCVFCENNNEPAAVVNSHSVRDCLGRVLCPKLRIYVCPICKASGDEAHTVKYCPKKPIITMEIAEKQKFIT